MWKFLQREDTNKVAGDIKTKAGWKVTERQWWKLQKEPLIRYLHCARVAEGGVIHTKKMWQSREDIDVPRIMENRQRWGKEKKGEKDEQKSKNETLKFKTI